MVRKALNIANESQMKFSRSLFRTLTITGKRGCKGSNRDKAVSSLLNIPAENRHPRRKVRHLHIMGSAPQGANT